MKLEMFYLSILAPLLVGMSFGAAVTGCKAQQMTASGSKIVMLYDEPSDCENLGVVIGFAGGMTGAYSKPSVLRRSAENDARNQAAARGGTHLLLHPEELAQGDGRGPDYQDTEPAMAHGSGTGSSISVPATAYKCSPEALAAAAATKAAGTFVEVQAPTSISIGQLGTLKHITVYRQSPLPSGEGTGENETLVVTDPRQIDAVVESLDQVAADPMKYIPTHRVELVGELGVQSLLYGFGYLQYAGSVYRLTNGVFESVLQLREETAAAPDQPATQE